MSETSKRPISDTDQIEPQNHLLLIRRLRELSNAGYATMWQRIEVASIAMILEESTITAGKIWQLVLTHYGIHSSVSSTPDPSNDSGWLAQPLADRTLVWDHLTMLSAEREIAAVPVLPGPYDDHDTPEAVTLRRQILDFHTQGLNLMARRFGATISGEDILEGLARELGHDIEHHLAIQWLGSPYAIGASLYSLPMSGSGGFGIDGQNLYTLKAIVLALKNSIAEYKDMKATDTDEEFAKETLGRIDLWLMLLKGFTYAMVNAGQGWVMMASLPRHPELADDIPDLLIKGRDIINRNDRSQQIPKWGGDLRSELGREIANTITEDLVARFMLRLQEERDADIRTRL